MGTRIPGEVAAELHARLAAMTAYERAELRKEGARMQVDRSEKALEKRREYLRNYRARIALASRLGLLED